MTQVTEKITVGVFRCNAGHQIDCVNGEPPKMVLTFATGPGLPGQSLTSNGYCPICFLDWIGKSFGLVGIGQKVVERVVSPAELSMATGVKPS